MAAETHQHIFEGQNEQEPEKENQYSFLVLLL